MTSAIDPAAVEIELTEGEYIAPRGKRELTWLVRYNDGWVHISKWPSASIERRKAASGTVWENRTRLVVVPGTLLTRVDSRPAPYQERDALDYLKRGEGSARQVVRQEYRVGRRGQLLKQA